MRTIERFIDHGRVNCPARGDIDVDLCFTCPKLANIRHEGAGDVLVCGGAARTPRALVAVPWL